MSKNGYLHIPWKYDQSIEFVDGVAVSDETAEAYPTNIFYWLDKDADEESMAYTEATAPMWLFNLYKEAMNL